MTLELRNISKSYDGGRTFAVDIDGLSVAQSARQLRRRIAGRIGGLP